MFWQLACITCSLLMLFLSLYDVYFCAVFINTLNWVVELTICTDLGRVFFCGNLVLTCAKIFIFFKQAVFRLLHISFWASDERRDFTFRVLNWFFAWWLTAKSVVKAIRHSNDRWLDQRRVHLVNQTSLIAHLLEFFRTLLRFFTFRVFPPFVFTQDLLKSDRTTGLIAHLWSTIRF